MDLTVHTIAVQSPIKPSPLKIERPTRGALNIVVKENSRVKILVDSVCNCLEKNEKEINAWAHNKRIKPKEEINNIKNILMKSYENSENNEKAKEKNNFCNIKS